MEEFAGLAAGAVLGPVLVVWLVMRGKLKRSQAEFDAALSKLQSDSKAAMEAEQARFAALVAEAKKAAGESEAKLTDVEQRFATHREVADRRATDAAQEISRLESDLAGTREVAAQLAPTQARIRDLEGALVAEQGRVKAQGQAIEAMTARVSDFEKRLAEAQDLVIKHKAEMEEAEAELAKVQAEHAAYVAAGGLEGELIKSRESNQQAEAKIAQLQKSLKAAETRAELVQKEFMNVVGVASAPTPGSAAPMTDKKVRDLEEKLAQMEAESRKRAREDGYKIAELEYRLSEAQEAAGQSSAAAKDDTPPSSPTPPEPEKEA